MRSHARLAAALALTSVLIVGVAARQDGQPAPSPGRAAPEFTLPATATDVAFSEGLVVGLLGSYGRSAAPSDFLAWQLATGAFKEPREGDVLGPDDRNRTQTWTRVQANAEGWIQNRALSNGYLFATVNSARARTMILDASGYYVVRVNGEPRGGEKYGTTIVRHPVRLHAGRNTFLFQGERGRLRARLYDPPAPVSFIDSDATLPDLVLGDSGPVWAGVRLVNATEDPINSVEVSFSIAGQAGTVHIPATVPPMMTRKLAIPLAIHAPAAEGALTLTLKAGANTGRRIFDTPPLELAMKAVAPTTHYTRTFVSEIDGSVQYYAVAPMVGQVPAGGRPALVLSLHGAGVEATNQAHAYKPKDWTYVVAATNRRPYGFDWEDWGRLDAMEVLADASRLFNADPARTYLTGHSMGGHGTWQVGATLPDLWAAIAPSAGWHSFSSYGGGPVYKDPSPVEAMLVRANHPGETTELARNFLHYGIYILHGDQDDNVPVAQARYMRELLSKFHADFSYYERPGAGHWWGDECVDWPPLFDFLARHTRKPDAEAARVELVTANPGISARSHWAAIEAQEHPLEYSRIAIDGDPKTGAFKGTTTNVARLSLDAKTRPGLVSAQTHVPVDLDGTHLDATPDSDGWLHLARTGSTWQTAARASEALKGPQRSGGFKDAFRHRVVLVYGTAGNAEENQRAFNKARFDAETFWYRGNASVDVVADRTFDARAMRDRNVVLYGNADTNAAWATLLGNSPIDIRNGRARIGDRTFTGADLATYFIRPRPDSAVASVGVVAWTGLAGWMAAGPVQYFVSGAGFPDVLLFSADMLRVGTAGIRAIGWFGNDWSVEHGDFVWGTTQSPKSEADLGHRTSDIGR